MMTRLMSLSIRTQILLLAFIVAIPAAGIIVYSGIKMREEALNVARMETQRLVDNIASEQRNLVAGTDQLMTVLAQLPEVKRKEKDKVEHVLRKLREQNPIYYHLFMADQNGNVWADALPLPSPQHVGDRRYFRSAIASGKLSSGEYVVSRLTSEPIFNLAYPVKDDHGSVVGIIGAAFNLKQYLQVLDRSELPPDTSFVLLDHKGTVLYRPVDLDKYIGKQYDPVLFKQMQEGPDVYTYSSIRAIAGDNRILTYRKLRLPGEQSPYLYIRAGIPLAAVLGEANEVLIRNLVLFSSVLALAILFAWFIGKRSIADRVTLLENATRDLANGDLHVRVSDLVVGGELGRLGTTFDTMAHQLAVREQALIDSERNYREMFNATQDAIFVHDADSGEILAMNKTVEVMYGYSREEVMHRTVQDLSSGEPPYTLQEARAWIRKTFAEGPQHFDWLARRKNGELFWTEVVLSATRIGGAGRVLSVVRDITERRNADETLRAKTEELDRYFTHALDLLCIADTDGYFRRLNKEWEAVLGYSVSELEGTRFLDYVHPEDLDETVSALAQLGAQEELLNFVNRYRAKDGSYHWIEWRSFPTGKLIYAVARDITERRRGEEALRESRNLLQTVLDTIPARVFWKDRDLRYLGCNQPFALDAGFPSPEAMIGKDDYQMGWREQADLYRSDDRQVLESGKPKINYEEPQTTPDGRHIWLRTNKVPLQSTDGAIWGVLGTYEDITEYKQAEESLRQAALIVENSPVMLFRWKAAEGWPVVLVSQNVAQIGYTPEELLDGSVMFASIVHPDDLERVGREVQAYTASGADVFQQEYRLITKDGQVRWIDDRTVVERDDTGQVTHYQGIVIDITARKLAETGLQQSLSMLQATLESTFDAILVVSADGSKITGYNQRFAELMKIPLNLLATGDDPPVLQHVTRQLKDPDAFFARVRQLYAQPEEESFDVLELADGRTLERLSRPQRIEGRPVGRVWSFRDITERKRADAERERLIGELELRNAELERFTYTVSHDLKSPLITMKGFLGYLEKDALAGNWERVHADIGRIMDATDKMDRLLRELLELSRIGRMMNPPEQVPFEAIVNEAIGLVAGQLQERGVTVAIASGLPVVFGDRLRLVEVVQNLVDNAAKFMGKQPAPLIEVGVRTEEGVGRTVFFVRDNGIGIEPRYQEKVFGLFDKLDPASEGTGVGLALVKRIIEVHGGHIWIESEGIGKGTAFCFTIPMPKNAPSGGGL
jgi:PAS domain S-box-containing protein